MPLLPQPVFNQGSESSGSVPHHLPLEESQPEDDENGHAASGDLPSDPALGVDARNGHAASGDLPYDSTLGVDARNVQSAPSSLAANADAVPYFVALSPSFWENAPIENMLAGGRLVRDNLVTVNISSTILHGVLQSQPFPAANSSFSFSAPSTSAAHLRPCWSAYSFFFEERFYMFRNLPSQSMGEFVRLIEESWGRLTEAERGVYTDQERMDRERYEIELNEYQERTGRTQSK